MKYSKLTVSTLIVGTLLTAPSFAGAQTGPTAKQKSQIEYLMKYGHEKNGKHPTSSQAFAVVKEYPKVPTMAQYKEYHNVHVIVKGVHASDIPDQGNLQFTVDFDYSMSLGWGLNITYFGFHETLGWHYNRGDNLVSNYWVKGYSFVTKAGALLAHYVGLQSGNGYPYWIEGGGGSQNGNALSTWEAYYSIQQFEWGYGPVSVSVDLHMYMAGYANGTNGACGTF